MEGTGSRKPLDAVDVEILKTLQAEGRTTWARLAEIVGMSAPSATDRVRRLEEDGYISGFHAVLWPEALGLGTLGFVAVSIGDPEKHRTLLEHVRRLAEVQECHVIAGEYDYLLKIRCDTTEGLAAFLRDEVKSLPGVSRTNTLLVLETVKETRSLLVPEAVDGPPAE